LADREGDQSVSRYNEQLREQIQVGFSIQNTSHFKYKFFKTAEGTRID
jgi:hypothetical protein